MENTMGNYMDFEMRQDFKSITYSFVITFKLPNFSVLVALLSNTVARFISLPFTAFSTYLLVVKP